jgi:hypothetical protein
VPLTSALSVLHRFCSPLESIGDCIPICSWAGSRPEQPTAFSNPSGGIIRIQVVDVQFGIGWFKSSHSKAGFPATSFF